MSRALLLSVFLLAGAACGDSHGTEDSGIDFDARVGDGSTPDGDLDTSLLGNDDVGGPCDDSNACGDFCIDESQGFPGGYCTADCGGSGTCPDDAICTPVGADLFICLSTCDPASSERTCRSGYGCTEDYGVCIPGCQDDTDCGEGLRCDRRGGFSGEGSCFDPDSRLGDACEVETMCPAGSFCLPEEYSGWPGGTCIRGGCDVELISGGVCESGEVCLPTGREGSCFAGCGDDRDCRDGYLCLEAEGYPGRRYCAPGCTDDGECSDGRVCNPALGTCDVPFMAADLGQECSRVPEVCQGGTCLSEFDSGFPLSYCLHVGCDLDAAPGASGCPAGGVCAESVGGAGVCLLGCSGPADCTRDGYECRRSDGSDATSEMACLPRCTSDASCGNPGFVCNEGTGRCRPLFFRPQLGAACEGPGECIGGTCLEEDRHGWPAGACTFPGCRLGGSGPAESCPSGSTCIDDENGDPDLGVCAETCSTMSSSCRAGYQCITQGAETDGYCGPGCNDDRQCERGRSCERATGRCR